MFTRLLGAALVAANVFCGSWAQAEEPALLAVRIDGMSPYFSFEGTDRRVIAFNLNFVNVDGNNVCRLTVLTEQTRTGSFPNPLSEVVVVLGRGQETKVTAFSKPRNQDTLTFVCEGGKVGDVLLMAYVPTNSHIKLK
jgi:hypothetical protein